MLAVSSVLCYDLAMAKNDGVYEIGYLLAPLIPPEGVAEAVSELIKTPITRAGGGVTKELAPRMIALAYSITKHLDNKNVTFKEAYFGALQFNADPGAVPMIDAALRKANQVVRYLCIKAPKYEEAAAPRQPRDEAAVSSPEGASRSKEAVIDKEIDNLLTPAE
jgi:ribosomal protein S6